MQKNCKGPQPLYELLGGEKKLSISLRTFRAVYAGQLPPSMNFFSSVFPDIPEHMKKEALVAFFASNVEDEKSSSSLCDYLMQNLNVKIDSSVESLWKKNDAKFFSEKQLKYLSSSNTAIRAYNRLVCHESIDEEEANASGYIDALNMLIELGIAIKDGKKYSRSGSLFRLPHQDNSPGELVAPASDFILRHLSAYLAREGAPGQQELGYSFHTCRKSDAQKILEQMQYFKRWVQNMGLKEDHPDEVGFVWVDFARILIRNRDY